ncbi:MAG: hypothetical protein ACQEQX_04675 [Thermodesulfobacteriota bacterium]
MEVSFKKQPKGGDATWFRCFEANWHEVWMNQSEKEKNMKRICLVTLVLVFGLCLASTALAGSKEAAKKNVEDVVAAINEGTDPESINANDYEPYVFILEEDGMLVVHPSLAGKSLEEEAPPVYEAIANAVEEGEETADYMWQGSMKHSFLQQTDSGLIVGSGYSK